MRRKDREVTAPERIREIIQACDCIRLGICDGDTAYVVPLSFGFTEGGGSYAFYLHCASVGKKLDLLRRNPHVGFELDTHHVLVSGERACDYTLRYQSVMGTGTVTWLTSAEAKKEALGHLMRQCSGLDRWTFTDAEVERVTLLRLDAAELTCKEHL